MPRVCSATTGIPATGAPSARRDTEGTRCMRSGCTTPEDTSRCGFNSVFDGGR